MSYLKYIKPVIIALSFIFLVYQNPWSAIALFLIYDLSEGAHKYFEQKQLKFNAEQIAKLDWLEKEVKGLNQIQNLKNKF